MKPAGKGFQKILGTKGILDLPGIRPPRKPTPPKLKLPPKPLPLRTYFQSDTHLVAFYIRWLIPDKPVFLEASLKSELIQKLRRLYVRGILASRIHEAMSQLPDREKKAVLLSVLSGRWLELISPVSGKANLAFSIQKQ